MNDITIRRATLADLDTLMAWRMEVLHCVFSLSADADTTALRQTNDAYYRQQLPQGGHVACFADLDGESVGCGGLCLYNEMPSPDNPTGRCAYLMNIYVRPEHRGRGIAKRIVRWLVGQALQRGISKIYLETSEAARPLYHSFGFNDMPDMLHLTTTRTEAPSSGVSPLEFI